MNVWILNHYAITPDMPGGTRHYDFGRELVKRGYKVTIFASSFHYLRLKESKLKPDEEYRIENYEGINFVWVKTFPYKKNDWRRVLNMLTYSIKAYKVGRRLVKLSKLEKPNVIIGSSVHLFAVLSAYFLSKCFKAKFIMEVRDLWPQTLIEVGEISKYHPIVLLFKALEIFLYKRAEKIITLLPFAHEYITSLGIKKEKIVWIPNGVDLSRFNYTQRVSKNKHPNKFVVMYLGAHGKANALDVVVKAAKIVQNKGLNDVQFVFVGDGPEKPYLIKLAKNLNLTNIEFHAPIPKFQIPQKLLEASALLISTKNVSLYKYGISLNKLFDFLAASKPIIFATNARNNPVYEAKCGITVLPNSPEDLAEAVIKLHQLPREERIKMGKRGRKYVEKHFDIKKLVDKLEKVLR